MLRNVSIFNSVGGTVDEEIWRGEVQSGDRMIQGVFWLGERV